MEWKRAVVLAIGAHPDDIELGCGGTLYSIIKSGGKVTAVYLTKGEKSGDAKIRMQESIEALRVIGVGDVFFGNFPDTEIPNSHVVIEFIENFSQKNNFGMVFTHSISDFHQDHRLVAWLTRSACRDVPRILSYETPRVGPSFTPAYFVDISKCLTIKAKALKCHRSQGKKRYFAYMSTVSLARFRGSQVGVRAAEAFEVIRYLEDFRQ